MLSENAKRWVAALRSGKYSQARHRLHYKDNGYCCLGVACEVALEAGLLLQIEVEPDHRKERYVIKYDMASTSLPARVQQWLGLSSPLGRYFPGNGTGSTALAFDNDGGKTFKEIADIIESEPEGLFGQFNHH